MLSCFNQLLHLSAPFLTTLSIVLSIALFMALAAYHRIVRATGLKYRRRSNLIVLASFLPQ